ncbi:MAG: hypothetical protein HY682_05035 [Chloroflexi bacterium]|nr:hypothetical protein [Chloroflexota bacterium]
MPDRPPDALGYPVESPPEGEAHPGTLDLDLGLALAVLDQEKYRTLAERLRRAGFSMDRNPKGNPTRQRWRVEAGGRWATVDFLTPPSGPHDRGGRLRDIEPDFAAVITPGLHLAFADRTRVTLTGTTLTGERASRDIWVCGPGAFVVLKGLAFNGRGKRKDAFDLYYVLRYLSVAEVARCLRPLRSDDSVKEALAILERDFSTLDSVGPRRAAEFLRRALDEEIQADVIGFVAQFLEDLRS